MVSIEFGRSPLLGKLYRRTSGSAGPFQFGRRDFKRGGGEGRKKRKKNEKKKRRERRERAWFRFPIVNSKFNSSQKRVQSRGRVDSFGKIGTYLIASVFEREGEGKKERKGKKKKKRDRARIESNRNRSLLDRSAREKKYSGREKLSWGTRSFEWIKPVDRNWRIYMKKIIIGIEKKREKKNLKNSEWGTGRRDRITGKKNIRVVDKSE